MTEQTAAHPLLDVSDLTVEFATRRGISISPWARARRWASSENPVPENP